jgi:hypothetical protein
MTELLLHIAHPQEGEFEKIAPSIYYHQQTSSFFRLAFLPSTVIFQNEQISQPHLATFTKYDPYFYAINLLLKKIVPLDQLPAKLVHLDLAKIAEIKSNGGQDAYVYNKEKIYDYLEGKVERLQKCLAHSLGEKTLEVDKQMITEKEIREETVVILKSEIEDKQFIDAFAKERYNYENVRKLVPYREEPEEFVTRKKPVAKKEPKQ